MHRRIHTGIRVITTTLVIALAHDAAAFCKPSASADQVVARSWQVFAHLEDVIGSATGAKAPVSMRRHMRTVVRAFIAMRLGSWERSGAALPGPPLLGIAAPLVERPPNPGAPAFTRIVAPPSARSLCHVHLPPRLVPVPSRSTYQLRGPPIYA